MRTLCVLTGILLLAATMASAVMTTITVLGPDRQPVAGAKVYGFLSPTSALNVTEFGTTDTRGQAQGELALNTSAEQPSAYAVVYQPGMGLALAAITNSTVTVQLSASMTVSGKVVDGAGAPVAGVKMRLQYVRGNTRNTTIAAVVPALADAFTAVTGADGSWRLADVPVGGVAIVFLEDPRYVREQCEISTAPQTMPIVTTVRPGTRIAGRLVNAAGDPVANVRLYASSEVGLTSGFTTVLSDADGHFSLMGLPPGSYTLGVIGEWLLEPPVHGIKTRAGEETPVADVIVKQGATISGRVLEKETQTPIANARVVVTNAADAGRMISTVTRADGSFTFFLTPGNYQVQASNAQGSSVEHDETAASTTVDVQAGETKTVTLYLDKGTTLSGTVVDEQGKPVPLLSFNAQILCGQCGEKGCAKDRSVNGQSDPAGRFTVSGLTDGPLLLSLRDEFKSPEWILDKPQYVAKPGAAPVTFTVRHAEMQTLTGRVLDTEEQPVAGAQIDATIYMRGKDNNITSIFEKDGIVTDADGRYTIACRLKDIVRLRSVGKDGYRLRQLGEFSTQDGVGSISDCVLARMDGTLSGKVVGKDGKPLAEITVVSLESGGNARAKTGADGTFSLTNIPRGDASVLAISPTMSGGWSGQASATGISITAAPLQKNDITSDMVLDAWAQNGCPNRLAVARVFLNEGLEKALQVLTSDGSEVEDTDRASLLQAYVSANPDEALKVAVAQLDLLSTPREQFYAAIAVGMAAAKSDPVLAEHCYAIAKMHVTPNQHPVMQCDRYSQLIQLAHLLGHDDDVNTIMEHLIPIARENQSFMSVVRAAATVSPELAQRLWEGLPDDKRRSAFTTAIPIIARYDAAAAERLKATLTEQERVNLQGSTNQALYSAKELRELAKTDPAAALAKAKNAPGMYLRTQALLAVLPYQPRDVALRECRTMLENRGNFGSARAFLLPKAMRYAYNLDPETGRALHGIFVETHLRSDLRSMATYIPTYAYYAAPIDPMETRILLEVGFVNLLEAGNSIGSSTYGYYPLAMMAFNQRRALVMADQAGQYRGQAYAELLRYLRAGEEERLWNLF